MPHELDNLALALRQAQDARDAQDAAQLIQHPSSALRVPVPILIKRATAWDDNTGLAFHSPGTIVQYGVFGLPPGQRATITKFGHVWKAFLFRNGHSVCDWEGEHSDADAAHAALNEFVRISRLQDAARHGYAKKTH
jgi:hypothetical protein